MKLTIRIIALVYCFCRRGRCFGLFFNRKPDRQPPIGYRKLASSRLRPHGPDLQPVCSSQRRSRAMTRKCQTDLQFFG